ncbi:MAG: IS982 family transposase [Candidatus Poribacteria bacterium]|nr:IS982 family transposase [Candidatus Poribacteria bacterium]
MELTIVAVYTICNDLLISLGHQTHPNAQMTDAEVMTTAIIAAQFFCGNHQRACSVLKNHGYIPNMLGHSRYNRPLHWIPHLFQILFEYFAEVSKSNNPNGIYAIDTYPVAVCDNIRISQCRLYQGEEWRGPIASKRRHFYGLKAHLMVTESGPIVEVFFTSGKWNDVRGMRYFPYGLPQDSVVYADKAYCNYGIEDELKEVGTTFKPHQKKNLKHQFPSWEVYLQHLHRKRVEVTNSLITQLLPKSTHAVTATGFELKLFLFIIATNIKQLYGDR